jgi:hypothetical protein
MAYMGICLVSNKLSGLSSIAEITTSRFKEHIQHIRPIPKKAEPNATLPNLCQCASENLIDYHPRHEAAVSIKQPPSPPSGGCGGTGALAMPKGSPTIFNAGLSSY